MATSFAAVHAAAKRLRNHANMTALATSRTLNALSGCQVFMKCENFQRTGSFKFRGALNALSIIVDDGNAAAGVVTHSSGNHGQAVAAAAQLLDVTAAVVVPEGTPQCKIDAIAGYGADVSLCMPTQKGRTDAVAAIAARTGAFIIHPYNHPDVIAGQGTIALEVHAQVQQQHDCGLDALLVPTSGGGMIAGIAVASHGVDSKTRIMAVAPKGKRLAESLASRNRILCPDLADQLLPTIADAIRTQPIGEVPWPSVQALVDPCVMEASDDALRSASRFAFERLKLVIEPAAATGLACLLDGQVLRSFHELGRRPRVGVVLCGGNVDVSKPLSWMC